MVFLTDEVVSVSTRTRLTSGALTLVVAQVLQQGANFLANVVIVRALTKADFGIAATFGLTVSLLEMSTALGVENLIVQSPRGEESRFQHAIQAARFAQGLLLSLALLALASPLAQLFKAEEYTWAYQMLALVPLFQGIVHFDRFRFHRHLRYGPGAIIDTIAQLVGLGLVAVLSLCMPDPRLGLALYLCRPFVRGLASHLLAERPYRWSVERSHFREIIRFGWPVLLNGIVLFLVFHGDRLLIGSAETIHEQLGFDGLRDLQPYSKVDLAEYSVAFSLALVATMAVNRILDPLALPALAEVQADPQRFSRRLAVSAESFGVLGTAIAVFFILGAGPLVVLLYSDRYAGVDAFVGWLGIAQGLRTLRMSPAGAGIALGDTRIPLVGNLGRSGGFVGAAICTIVSAELVWIARSAVLGEILAFLVIGVMLRRRHRIQLRSLARSAAVLIGCSLACLMIRPLCASLGDWPRMGLALLAVTGTSLGALVTLPSLRREFLRALGSRRAGRA